MSGGSLSRDEARTARLLFARELSEGSLDPAQLHRPEVERAVRVGLVPSSLTRSYQRWLVRRGRAGYEQTLLAPLLRARRAVLGAAAAADPARLLVRVDEFPFYGNFAGDDLWTQPYRVFHRQMSGAPYLLAVLPRVARDPLDCEQQDERDLLPAELEVLDQLASDGVSFAQHGYNHRTRDPRRHSELAGLDAEALTARLEAGRARLADAGIVPRAFVAPFNSFDAEQWPLLAKRFDVVCGGPESVRRMGLQATPQWRGEAVYLPAYEPFYGRACGMLDALARIIESAAGLWVPIVLHYAWEADDEWRGLGELVRRFGEHFAPWGEFESAVAVSRVEPPRAL